MADAAQAYAADHPLALVDHWQPADLQCLHVPHRLGESSRQQWMPGVITSRAAAPRASKLSCANPSDNVAVSHHADQLVVLSNRNGAYIMLTLNFASSVTGVSGLTSRITSLTFMADLRFTLSDSCTAAKPHSITCVYRKLKPGRSDGEARRGWVVNE